MSDLSPITCNELRDGTPEENWRGAVDHEFLRACASGEIKEDQFNTWLVQDRHFVKGFARWFMQLAAQCPDEHLMALLGGVSALEDELKWFAACLEEKSLDPDTPVHPTCKEYVTEMRENFVKQPYAVQCVALWGIEVIYNKAWHDVLKSDKLPEVYQSAAKRWGNEGFGQYCDVLKKQADDALRAASQTDEARADVSERARCVWRKVVELEQKFWQMAYS